MDLVTAKLSELADFAADAFVLGLSDAASGSGRRSAPGIALRLMAIDDLRFERYHATRFHAVYKAGYDLGVQNAMELKRREAAKLSA